MESLVPVAALVIVNLALLWLLMAAPVGRRTLRLVRRYHTSPEKLWDAIYPLGTNATWHPSVLSVQPLDEAGNLARLAYSHLDRKGKPIERILQITKEFEFGYRARVVDDSALDKSFWQNFEESRHLQPVDGDVEMVVEQTDRYRGLAFLIFRYFALRREMLALEGWLRTGRAERVGIFERPAMQVFMAVVSTLLLWPFFGLNQSGLVFSTMLTVVIALHELGHMAAYRAFGHTSARMIFLPLLGGIAIGGRPYNSLFEVATCALMGPGMSAFLVPIVIGLYQVIHSLSGDLFWIEQKLLFFILVLGAFNLLNLLPMHRFDGGQVLRQLFTDKRLLALGSFGVTAIILGTGWEIGLPSIALIAALAVFTLMSLIGAGDVKPRADLDPMQPAERLLAGLGLYSAVVIHSYAIIFASDRLFG